ncbi:MAG: hypothetical protein ACXVAY_13180 [Mucilaginibacter sp.]
MKKNLFLSVTAFLTYLIIFSSCNKNTTTPTLLLGPAHQRNRDVTNYIDTIYISNPGRIYLDSQPANNPNYYDTIYTVRTHHGPNSNLPTDNITVFLNSTYKQTPTSLPYSVYAGADQFFLTLTDRTHTTFSLSLAYNTLSSRHQYTGYYTETYHITVALVQDANGNDITNQVCIIPSTGIDAHVGGTVYGGGLDTISCPTCGSHF